MKKRAKRRKISSFNELYYENHEDNFKAELLPSWMESYTNYIRADIEQTLPEYYKKFKQGTIVMIDFGVRVGSEISGQHFGVTLSNKDDKFQRNILVAPLTSHPGRNHISLGYEIMQNMNDRFNEKSKETLEIISYMEEEMENLAKKVNDLSNGVEKDFFTQNNIKVTEENLHLTIRIPGRSETSPVNVKQKEFINKLKQYNYTEFPRLKKFIESVSELLDKADSFIPRFNKANKNILILNSLIAKAKRYNKETYADISNITTISKLRVTKFSENNLSENTYASQNSINHIKERLNKLI
ncbi:type II toxin-antitoxin system PemK/MazF family toxin [Pediococcus acidilactici]|uniref:type II toxin-antitoxin system PemK/MazF family toxin n=2 Tax=Lactobacillaceae TaxID=33958 RepID=UPI0003C33656|nr:MULTISPECIES: type II toxin-antitoxin system PemK/MazF family toxin [Pediococcus]AHA05902.1 hypothetical protein T256_02395 [Pediococcus pentosaceus SL4]MCT3032761.1 hypothetical protein [Pediococcus pentosaceus]NBI15658.1 type II toxin-antitoxin system PemK/MazF family toxin [Pediococcus acidilactici]NFA46147.1 hypothetical protein [Pediococcus acidilactici]NFA47197.1 hypothetical protein [Pediococcus acidilactici]